MAEYCTNEECQRTSAICTNYKKIIQELNVKVNYQKKTLDNYRQLNIKTFEDITELESDIRDKEEFINKIKKERSDLKKDVKFLNEKIEIKNQDILKMQLDLEGYVKTAKASNKTLEEENEYLRKEIEVIQKNMKIEKNKEERKEKEMLNEVKLLETEVNNLKRVNNEKEMQLLDLMKENDEINKKNEALYTFNCEHDTNEVIEEKKQTQSSIADELNLCDVIHLDLERFSCHICEKKFAEKKHVSKHIKDVHVKEEEAKLLNLEKNVTSQLLVVTNSIHKLMEHEVSRKDKPCNCHRGASQTYCVINHGKHNWKKSESKDFIEKLKVVKKAVFKNGGESREAEEAHHPVQKGGVS